MSSKGEWQYVPKGSRVVSAPAFWMAAFALSLCIINGGLAIYRDGSLLPTIEQDTQVQGAACSATAQD